MAVVAPIVSTWDNTGVRKATKAFGGLTDSAKRSFGKIADAAKTTAIAIAGIGTAGVIGAKKAIDAASDLAETQSKVAQIFGDSSTKVEEFAKTTADTLGQSRTDALNAAADFATFGKAAGLGGDELADFSTELVTLSSDLASFYNTEPAEAAEAIAAALRGESEPLRRYGVLLNDAALKQAAFEMGIYDGEGALTAQQKVLAANQVILDQTTDAQGDFARTADGLANSQRRLRARFSDVVTEIGTRLLPVALKITDFFLDRVIPAVEFVGTVFGAAGLGGVIKLFAFIVESQLGRAIDFAVDLFGRFVRYLRDVALPFVIEQLGRLGQALVDWISPRIGPAIDALVDYLERIGRWFIYTAVPFLYDKALELGAQLVNWIEPRIVPALEALGGWIGKIATWFVQDALPVIVDKTVELGNAIVDWITPRIRPALEKLGEWLFRILTWLLEIALPAIIAATVKLGSALVDWIKKIEPEIGPALQRFLGQASEWFIRVGIPGFFDLGKAAGKATVDGILSGLRGEANRLLNATDYLPGIAGIRGALESAGALLSRFGVPGLATGGIVTGPTLAMIGEAGPEAVIPLDKAGAMGNTYNITVNGAVDPVSTARQIRQILQRDQSRLGLPTAV